MPKIIALAGQKGSGKTALARTIAKTHHFWILPFARPIKLMIGSLLTYQGISQSTVQQMLNGELKETPSPYLADRSPRYVMQTLGTEWRDMIGRNLWIEIWENAISKVDRVIVDDLRFPHEAEMIHRLGGKVIRIIRPDLPPAQDSHQSETHIFQLPVDLELSNSSSILNLLDELSSKIDLT